MPPHHCPHCRPISIPINTPSLFPFPSPSLTPLTPHPFPPAIPPAPTAPPSLSPLTPHPCPHHNPTDVPTAPTSLPPPHPIPHLHPPTHHGAGHRHAGRFLVIAVRHLRSEVLWGGGREGAERRGGGKGGPLQWGVRMGTPPYSLRRGLEVLEGLGVPGGQAVQGCHLCRGGRGVPIRGGGEGVSSSGAPGVGVRRAGWCRGYAPCLLWGRCLL